MKQIFYIILLFGFLFSSFTFTSAQSPLPASAPKSKEDPAEVIPLEELLPANTLGYAVATNLAGLQHGFHLLDAYKVMQGRLPKEEAAQKENPLSLATRFLSGGIEDAKALDEVRIGVALLMPELPDLKTLETKKIVMTAPQRSPLPEPLVVTLLEGLHLDTARKAREQFLTYYNENLVPIGKISEIKEVAYQGSKIDRFKNGDVGKWFGATYVIGPQAALDQLMKTREARAERLADDPGFIRLRAQMAPNTGIFSYLNGKPVNQILKSALGSGGVTNSVFGGLMGGVSELEAIRNVGFSSVFEREGVVDRLHLTLDSKQKNILSTLFSGPAAEFNGTKFIPVGTNVVGSLSLDWGRFYDEILVEMVYGAAVRAASMQERWAELEKQRKNNEAEHPDKQVRPRDQAILEAQLSVPQMNGEEIAKKIKAYEEKTNQELGFNLREEFLKNLGNEITVAYDIPRKSPLPATEEKPKIAQTGIAGLIEIKNREGAKTLLLKYAGYQMGGFAAGNRKEEDQGSEKHVKTEADIKEEREKREANTAMALSMMPKETYKNAEILSVFFLSLAFTDHYLIVADSKETIKELLDVSDGGKSIREDFNYSRAMNGAATAKFKLFVGPHYFDDVLNGFIKSWVTKASELPDDPGATMPSNIAATVAASIDGDDQHLSLEAFSPLGVPGTIAFWAIGNELESTRNRKETEARYKLYELNKAEKTYAKSNQNKYASLETLAKMDEATFRPDDLKNEAGNYKYEFQLKTDKKGFTMTATPIVYGRQGRKSFYLDDTGKIRAADKQGAVATAADEIDESGAREAAEEAEDAAKKAMDESADPPAPPPPPRRPKRNFRN